MSESKTKSSSEDVLVSEEEVRELFKSWKIPCVDLNYAVSSELNDIPYVVLGKDAYRGCEAHFFTIADKSLWIPELLPSGDIVLYYPIRDMRDHENLDSLMQRRAFAWELLIDAFEETFELLFLKARYKQDSTDVWAHQEKEDVISYEVPENMPIPIDKILKKVDRSIKDPILALNKVGFVTIESCSGMKKDHGGDAPFPAFVCLDDEYYHDVSAHLFTLAELAGWDPCWGAHGYDVFLYAVTDSEIEKEKAWIRLSEVAEQLGGELREYQKLTEPHQGYYFYRFRRERGLFSGCYCEKSRTLSGFVEELNKIDSEYYSDNKEK